MLTLKLSVKSAIILVLLLVVLPQGEWIVAQDACHDASHCLTEGRQTSESQRAGYPRCISRFARPSYNAKGYSAGYVGGGAGVLLGECRCPHEGTWGVDYDGILLPKSVWKLWSHGRRYQGGTGAYKTDGPHLHIAEE